MAILVIRLKINLLLLLFCLGYNTYHCVQSDISSCMKCDYGSNRFVCCKPFSFSALHSDMLWHRWVHRTLWVHGSTRTPPFIFQLNKHRFSRGGICWFAALMRITTWWLWNVCKKRFSLVCGKAIILIGFPHLHVYNRCQALDKDAN